jgi:ATP-dependent protease HslVU (ClpYQ) peptidase subunit
MDSAMARANQTQAEYREINVALKNDLFNLVEKLRIELHKKDQDLQKKDEELAKEKQEKQVCIYFYCFKFCT